MEDKEFILEALKRLTPDTSWHGETYADDKSLDNMDILEDMICFLLDELFCCSTVPEGNKGNGSFKAIAKRKQKAIRYIKERWLDRSITLEEFWNSKKTLAIRCKTEEEANKLCKAFDKLGKQWYGGDRYIYDNKWDRYKKDTCYSNNNYYGNIGYYTDRDYAIYQFEDIDLGDE